MPRPHIEFVHAQQLAWSASGLQEFGWPTLATKILSRDPETGACTTLMRLGASFADRAFTLTASCEWYLLDGQIALNGRRYGRDSYAYLPSGYTFDTLTSEHGAVLLAFFDRGPQRQASGASSTLPADTIECVDTYSMPWTCADIDPDVQFLRLSHKVLRHVPATGEKTILLSSGAQAFPHGMREAQLRHDCVEEMYLLGGDIVGERGVMYEGAYFWRPPRIWHGPFGSRRGSLSLIRFVDGHHRNEWSTHELAFDFAPLHQPALPEDYPAEAFRPWSPTAY
jgi:hypothetical protein